MQITRETLDSVVVGVNLIPGSLRDQLEGEPVLLVFLRFFGCIFGLETVADLRALSEKRADHPKVIFISEAKTIETQAFVRRYWSGAATISDPRPEMVAASGVGLECAEELFAERLPVRATRTRQGQRARPP
ncbi:MAG: hypothetical protein GY910_24465 [bacterium]|nr:hypothetical protein [bacterium]